MTGPLLNSAAVLVGGCFGVIFARFIPRRLQEGLPAAFAMISIAMGIAMIVKVQQLPAVAIAIILGLAIGELCYIEKGVQKLGNAIQSNLARIIPAHNHTMTREQYNQNFTALIVLFCAGGTGVVGALTEGISGDYQLLLVKSFLDLFASMIFATTFGAAVISISIPQLLVQGSLFLSASLIMPYMNDMTFGDFSACGGIIMIAVGLSIARIKLLAVVNFLPALVIIIPISIYWQEFFG